MKSIFIVLLFAYLSFSDILNIPSINLNIPNIISTEIVTKPQETINNVVNTVIDKTNDLITTIDTKINPIIDPIILLTLDAEIYKGYIEIKIQNGDTKSLLFYSTLIHDENCTYSNCFYGWINNYTASGEDTIIGYGNPTVLIQPVFQFKTNSEEDYIIVRNQNMDEVWAQIIEIFCQKINPQIIQNSTINNRIFSQAQNLQFNVAQTNIKNSNIIPNNPQNDVATSPQLDQPQSEAFIPKYLFSDVQASDLRGNQQKFAFIINPNNVNLNIQNNLALGDKFAKYSQSVNLPDLQFSDSLLNEAIILNSDYLVKSRLTQYSLKLNSDLGKFTTGEKTPALSLVLSLNFNLFKRTKESQSKLDSIKRLLSDTAKNIIYNFDTIALRRGKLGDLLFPGGILIDNGPKPGSADDVKFGNQKYSGINVVAQLKKADLVASSAIQPVISQQGSILQLQGNGNARLLQVLQNYTIYNYKKTLFSQTILGKTFKTQVQVKCYLLVLPFDHQVQCIGTINYELFGNVKSITIFNFKKSVAYSWSFSKTYSGTWGFTVWVGLPSPVNFIGINFSFSVSYVINLSVNAYTYGSNPYNFKIAALATTQVDTDSKASVRLVVIQGGVFIKGTLVKAGTDPTLTLSYYFFQKRIQVLAQWYFWIYAFQYKWGFFYRYWKLFSGWSGEIVISQWTINGVYGKWAIVNKSWNIYL